MIGRDALEEPLQTVDAEAVSEGNPKSGEFPFFPFCTLTIYSIGLHWNDKIIMSEVFRLLNAAGFIPAFVFGKGWTDWPILH
jgi:hypothetical protein